MYMKVCSLLDPSLDDRAHQETLVNQCNILPITGFVRHTILSVSMPINFHET